MMTANARAIVLTVVIPLLTWAAAGVANAGGFIMGNPPTALGTASTIVALCVWMAAAWYAGARSGASIMRFAVFWIAVLAGAPIASWALNASSGKSATRGGWVLPLLLLALMAPLYGLYALLPAWGAVAQGAVTAGTGLALTLAAYAAGRYSGQSVQQDTGGERP